MSAFITKDGVEIFYKDWGKGQPIVFSHGWPLSADDWDAQMLFFVSHGYRVIAHDRRGHGRSSQVGDGHDMDHYADDLAALSAHLDLKEAVHVGHSTGGGEVVHYLARHGEGRVAQAVIISAVPPLMVKTPGNPDGLPKEVFDGFQAQLAANRSQFYYEVAAGPFYGYNRPNSKPSQGAIWNWWRQGMMGGASAHFDGIVAFSQTDFTEDLKKITVPVLVMHGDDDQIVPYADSAPLSATLLPNGTLKDVARAFRMACPRPRPTRSMPTFFRSCGSRKWRRGSECLTMGLLTDISTLDRVLGTYATLLGTDFVGYRNHAYRVANLCVALAPSRCDQVEKVAVRIRIS